LIDLQSEPNFPKDGIKATQLVSTNNEKEAINSAELNKINQKSYNFLARD
jgi:hypothetical protein